MYKIENVKPLRLYKNKKLFIHSMEGDKRRGNLFILSAMDQQGIIDIINCPVLDTRFINGYFIEKVNVTNINGIHKKERIDLKTKWSDIKTNTSYITRTFPTVRQYNNLNLFYDISKYNDVFFNKSRTGNIAKRAGLYGEFLRDLLNRPYMANYMKRKLIINIDGMDLDRMGNSPVASLMYMAQFDNAMLKATLGNIEVLLLSPKHNIIIKLSADVLNVKTMGRFKSVIGILDKLNSEQPLSPEEKVLYDETERDFKYVPPGKFETAATKVVNQLAMSITGTNDPWSVLDPEEFGKIESLASDIADAKDINDAVELLDVLNNNPEFVQAVQNVVNEKVTAKAKRLNTKRNELLQQEQGTQKINNDGKTLKEILDNADSKIMERETYDIQTFNEKIKSSTLRDFEVSYNKHQREKDIVAIINSFSENKDVPLYIRKVERKNSSDEFNKKETWSILFEDDRRIRHTVTIDVPLFVDDHFLYLQEGKKQINHQLILYPIVKTGPDRVQCVSNYNKAFIFRYGAKVSPKIERLKKLIATTKSSVFKAVNGDNSSVNIKYLTNIDFDELASTFMSMNIKELNLLFHQPELRELIAEKGIDISKLKDDQLPIGFDGDKLVILNVTNGKVQGTDLDLPDYITEKLIKADGTLSNELEKISVGKKYVYSRVSILGRKFPLILFLAFNEGLTKVLTKAKVKYSFSDKKRRLSLSEKNSLGEIRFADGYLYYDLLPFRNSLLLNALQELPTESFNFKDFDNSEVYLDIFEMMFGTRNVGKGFRNFYQLFMDPITYEVCKDNNFPTDLLEYFLYANALLEDNAFIPENNMSLYRIRSNEIIIALLYRVLSRAYEQYANTANNTTPTKMSTPRDALLKEINECNIINDYSCINPISEAETYGAVTYKGPNGLNLTESFTLPKRSYDESMLGLMGASSPYNASVGVTRQLSFNPRIINNRGYIIPGNKKDKDLNIANIMTPAEILTPFAGNHDDAPRVAMVSGQSKHIIPVDKTDRLLIGNGAQRALPHLIGRDFINIAKQDGEVVEIDPTTKLMIVKYADGTYDTCDLSSKVAKNGGKNNPLPPKYNNCWEI